MPIQPNDFELEPGTLELPFQFAELLYNRVAY